MKRRQTLFLCIGIFISHDRNGSLSWAISIDMTTAQYPWALLSKMLRTDDDHQDFAPKAFTQALFTGSLLISYNDFDSLVIVTESFFFSAGHKDFRLSKIPRMEEVERMERKGSNKR
ncbi:hypothetical protein Leryth_022686 [Lithospermum erythrorhizon]|nr:hypothetical protein Leryth_022686 [Lithospermum erythrorhizon]